MITKIEIRPFVIHLLLLLLFFLFYRQLIKLIKLSLVYIIQWLDLTILFVLILITQLLCSRENFLGTFKRQHKIILHSRLSFPILISHLWWSEVKNICPFAGPGAQLRIQHVLKELVVLIGLNLESDSSAFFNNWVIHCVKHDDTIWTVSHSQLLGKDDKGAILAVSNEDRTFRWPDHYFWSFTLVDEALCDMLMDIELAIVTEANLEVFTI